MKLTLAAIDHYAREGYSVEAMLEKHGYTWGQYSAYVLLSQSMHPNEAMRQVNRMHNS